MSSGMLRRDISCRFIIIIIIIIIYYLKYLACYLSLMACFAGINVSQGSVATYARCSDF